MEMPDFLVISIPEEKCWGVAVLEGIEYQLHGMRHQSRESAYLWALRDKIRKTSASWLSSSIKPLTNELVKIIHYVFSSTDLTSEKLIEIIVEELRKSLTERILSDMDLNIHLLKDSTALGKVRKPAVSATASKS
jgi:hypothetical protein